MIFTLNSIHKMSQTSFDSTKNICIHNILFFQQHIYSALLFFMLTIIIYQK